MLVKNWMSKKVITVSPDESMHQAIYRLQEHGINLLPVVNGDRLVGIISDRDLKKASPSSATTLDMHELLYLISQIRINDLMTPSPVTVTPHHTVEEAAALLLEHRISGLPVLDDSDHLAGIITRSDIFNVLISVTGLGKKGIQLAVRLKDQPGEIRSIRNIIRTFGGQTTSILSSGEDAPEGFRNVYFRIIRLDRDSLPSLIEAVGRQGQPLYLVDHRENLRSIFDD